MLFDWAAFMPHPPILVPQVGKGREKEAAASLEGTRKLQAALYDTLAKAMPDVLLVLSPHQPAVPGALFVNSAPAFSGNLARFGAPEAAIEGTCPQAAFNELSAAVKTAGIALHAAAMPDISADHASIVPLLLIRDVFPEKRLPPILIAGPSGLSLEDAENLGKALRAMNGPRRWALLASGDLSHRLKQDGPYGLHPDGHIFDKALVQSLQTGNPGPVLALSAAQRENAAECGLRPALALLALTHAPLDVFSYEGPFGVGYCNAFWRNTQPEENQANGKKAAGADKSGLRISVRAVSSAQADSASGKGHPYARLARQTVTAHLNAAPLPNALDIAPDAALWSPCHGCFVSIKNKDGSLRGCIGTFLPTKDSLDQEIMTNALSASTRDPRFAPMTAAELPQAVFSVDVLSAPEQVREGMELDPKVYGVIVSKGGKRGLLLPDLEGVDSVPQQLAIAASKAGIRNLEGADIYRFTVNRYKETE